ncbi:ornithine--oxo-acid transaminase [Betaproteobacteria bacterium PRO7]|nr:ornithine--oxo-acid transaminase [Betaproteobacteria bacterium PRO7]
MQAPDRTAQQAIDLERRVAAANYHPLPVVLSQGRGEWLTDVDGKRYLDFMSAYSAVSHGHAHPRLIRALTEQAQRVAVTSRAYHSDTLGPFLERLTRLTGLDRALPANGGAESVETAIKAARRWGYRVKGIAADRANIVVARGNFHGRTTTIVGFSTESAYRADFGPFAPGFRHFDFGDIESLAAVIDENTCAVLIEPIQGEAGIVVPPDGFLRAARKLADERGVLLILDEIQSGLGRTGRWFAFQHEGIKPDGVILGKALGGGLLPVSCFVATDDVMRVFEPGSHGSTFGGNPLAAAVGLEALRVIEDEGLVARSAALGAHLLARLRAIESALVVDVRGRGLWAGVELDPRRVSARRVVERLAERGVLSKETHETVIRFAPPLAISRGALDWGLDVFVETLREFEPAPPREKNDAELPRIATRRRKDVHEEQRRSGSQPGAHLMMCAPDHFEVSYRINPWMDPAQWSVSADRLAQDARRGWQQLKCTYERLGARVDVQPPQPGLPDMVFTANAAVVLDRKALLARFLCAERRGEEAHDRAFFQALRARGAIDEIVETPQGLVFEGAGDAIWDATRSVLWTGYGQRSSREMQYVLAETYAVPTVALELVDPRFYHLDTCLCVLSGGEVIVHRPAFAAKSLGQIEELVGRDKLIVASDEDAHHLAVNSVCLGRDVVLCHASAALRGGLAERGYRPHVVPLDSFNRSGGAAYCLTLRLDLQTRPAAHDATPFIEDDFAEFRAAA